MQFSKYQLYGSFDWNRQKNWPERQGVVLLLSSRLEENDFKRNDCEDQYQNNWYKWIWYQIWPYQPWRQDLDRSLYPIKVQTWRLNFVYAALSFFFHPIKITGNLIASYGFLYSPANPVARQRNIRFKINWMRPFILLILFKVLTNSGSVAVLLRQRRFFISTVDS